MAALWIERVCNGEIQKPVDEITLLAEALGVRLTTDEEAALCGTEKGRAIRLIAIRLTAASEFGVYQEAVYAAMSRFRDTGGDAEVFAMKFGKLMDDLNNRAEEPGAEPQFAALVKVGARIGEREMSSSQEDPALRFYLTKFDYRVFAFVAIAIVVRMAFDDDWIRRYAMRFTVMCLFSGVSICLGRRAI